MGYKLGKPPIKFEKINDFIDFLKDLANPKCKIKELNLDGFLIENRNPNQEELGMLLQAINLNRSLKGNIVLFNANMDISTLLKINRMFIEKYHTPIDNKQVKVTKGDIFLDIFPGDVTGILEPGDTERTIENTNLFWWVREDLNKHLNHERQGNKGKVDENFLRSFNEKITELEKELEKTTKSATTSPKGIPSPQVASASTVASQVSDRGPVVFTRQAEGLKAVQRERSKSAPAVLSSEVTQERQTQERTKNATQEGTKAAIQKRTKALPKESAKAATLESAQVSQDRGKSAVIADRTRRHSEPLPVRAAPQTKEPQTARPADEELATPQTQPAKKSRMLTPQRQLEELKITRERERKLALDQFKQFEKNLKTTK